MIRIACFSDTHGDHRNPKLVRWFNQNSGDILIFAGDYQINRLDSGIDFLNWISELPFKKKVITFGNHDNNYELVMEESKKHEDIIILNHNKVKLFGINIFASPYSVNFGNWWFMQSEPELEDLYAKIPSDTEILITHSPAKGMLDATLNGYSAGSLALAERIKQLPKLKYHICGHIHEGYGKEKLNGITFYNSSLLNFGYEMTHLPHLFKY